MSAPPIVTQTKPASQATPVAPVAPVAPLHSYTEDLLGIVTGAAVTSFGLFLLTSARVVTGGTAGLSLLISYLTPVGFGVVFAVINLPFFVLAVRQKGWIFTAKTATAVALVAVFSVVHPAALHITDLNPVWAVVIGNLLAGLGIIILFRHGASLGGFNILALLLQERLGWRAGYVQMVFDVIVVLGSFAVVAPPLVLLSAAGAVIMNLIIALNHRPGRYAGSQPGR
jgi:uncharacterized membrane-anchored protein YitT (DUF2179 family)